MQITITDTGKTADLTILHNGIDYAGDLIGNAGDLHTDEDGNILMDQADYDWWSNQIDEIEKAEELIDAAAEEFDISRDEILGWITQPATEDGYLAYVRGVLEDYRAA